ncbi:MAG: hypothetical protein E6G07_13460 [Actinobacteria bacterium]|nr:MAG: hypothetical protein E6G07_13460 [Actinomycetota bacterium]
MKASRSLSLPQAARRARVARHVLLTAIHRHELPARLHYDRWWITPADLAVWRRRQRQRTSGSAA